MAIIEDYIPGAPPNQIPAAVRQYLDFELQRIASIINLQLVYAAPQAAAPARPENGVIAYADGTNWDPGSGAGFYGYQSGAWVKL